MTPYYIEVTVFTENDLDMVKEDGVSIISTSKKIFPGLYSLPFKTGWIGGANIKRLFSGPLAYIV
jgi:hypothetical protein